MLHFKPEEEILDICERVSVGTIKKVIKIAKIIAESEADKKVESFFKNIRENGINLGVFIARYVMKAKKT